MAEVTGISWTHHTLNFWIGCTKVSPACDHCYAEAEQDHRYHRVKWGNHPRHRTGADTWRKLAAMDRAALRAGERRLVFINSLSDFFDNQVPPEWRDEAWDTMRRCTALVFLLLTKRPQNIPGRLPPDWGPKGWPTVWLGTTVENMAEAGRRIPPLLQVPARKRFLSCEPMLGALDLRPWLAEGIDWVICGGESGPHRRSMDPDWARSLRDQSAAHGVAFFMKQMTGLTPKVGAAAVPPDLRIREWPEDEVTETEPESGEQPPRSDEPAPIANLPEVVGAIFIHALKGTLTADVVLAELRRAEPFNEDEATRLHLDLGDVTPWQEIDGYADAVDFWKPVILWCNHTEIVQWDGETLSVVSWETVREAIAEAVARGKVAQEKRRRIQRVNDLAEVMLPAKRKLKPVHHCIDEILAVAPPGRLRAEQIAAMNAILAMKADDPRFAECQTVGAYVQRAIDLGLGSSE